jgi:hypothetical protein
LIWSIGLLSILRPDPQKPSVHPNSRLSLSVKVLSGPDLLPNRQANFLEIPQRPIPCFDQQGHWGNRFQVKLPN